MPQKLNRNEYLCQHSTAVLSALNKSAHHSEYLTHYTDTKQTEILAQKLALDLKVTQADIIFGHGAEDLLVKIFCFYRNKTLWLVNFTWTNYHIIAQGLGIEVKTYDCVQIKNEFSSNFASLLTDLQIQNQSDPLSSALICITTPNNPTGHSVSFEEIEALIKQFPQHIFLLDAVYDDYPSALAMLPQTYSNAIFLGSFSKYFGMPGLRVGFAIGNLPAGFKLNLGLAPQSVELCLTALSDKNWYAENRRQMMEFAQNLSLHKFKNITVFCTNATFILARIENQLLEEEFFEKAELITQVIPKYFQREGYQYLRWSLGENKWNEKIIQYLNIIDNI